MFFKNKSICNKKFFKFCVRENHSLTPFIIINSNSIPESRKEEARMLSRKLFLEKKNLQNASKFFQNTSFDRSCANLDDYPPLEKIDGKIIGKEIAVVGRSNSGKRFFFK